MAFPTTSVLYSGTGAGENPVAGAFANVVVQPGDYKLQRLNNQIQSANATGWGSQHITTTYGPDCEVYGSYVAAADVGWQHNLFARVNNPNSSSLNGYQAAFVKSTSVKVYSITNNTFTLLNTFTGGGWSTTAQFGMRIVGNVITCYIDGTEVLNQIDNTYLTNGKIGCTTFGTADKGIVNFGGGDYSVAAPATVAFDPHPNLVAGTVAAAPVPATTGAYIGLTDATDFPDPATYGAYNMTVSAANSRAVLANSEVVRCTAKAGSVLTVTRAQEGTTARSILVGDQVIVALTKKSMTDIETLLTPRFNRTVGATASVADGGTITHGLGTTPDFVLVTGTVASNILTVTAKGATTFTVAIKTDAGAAGTTQTVYWMAGDIL